MRPRPVEQLAGTAEKRAGHRRQQIRNDKAGKQGEHDLLNAALPAELDDQAQQDREEQQEAKRQHPASEPVVVWDQWKAVDARRVDKPIGPAVLLNEIT